MKASGFEGDLNRFLKDYKYQPQLTSKLDELGDTPFTQEIINEIVLWKVDRYAHPTASILSNLDKLTTLTKGEHRKGQSVLESLLDVQGIALPMASTILRFRNPSVFQIIDRHAFWAIYGRKYPIYPATSSSRKVSVYFDYLDELIDLCERRKVRFETIDRLLYEFDKQENPPLSKRR